MPRPHLTLITNSSTRPILVVDDEPHVLRSIKRLLTRWGYSVVTVNGGARALDLCRDLTFCLVITDLRMPDMDGSELLRRLRKELGTDAPPVAVLTGDETRRELPELPWVESVILKPAAPPRLRALVDALCSAHRKPPYLVSTPPDDSPPEPPLVA